MTSINSINNFSAQASRGRSKANFHPDAKNQKSEMSTGAKIALGLGVRALAVAGIAYVLMSRGKGAKQAEQLTLPLLTNRKNYMSSTVRNALNTQSVANANEIVNNMQRINRITKGAIHNSKQAMYERLFGAVNA